MKRNILILFAVVSFIISLTGCGSSGHSNSVAPTPTTMTSVKVNLTQNGQPATGADAALYTPVAAMREGLVQAQNNSSLRTSIGVSNLEGVYKPTSTSADGTYTFTVPTGEYTLIANKGTSRAVVTNLRAATGVQETEVIEVASLTPTGIITGKVKAPSNITDFNIGGVFVYLGNTSLVALTNSEGKFTITGVPAKTTFPISAMTYYNGKTYKTLSSNEVTIFPESGYESDVGELALQAPETSLPYTITASVANTNTNAQIAFVVTNGAELYAGNVEKSEDGKSGEFSINVKSTGDYVVTVIGSNEGSQKVTVSNSSTPTLSFTMNNTSSENYGSVKGNIEYDNRYKSLLGNAPDVDRYLVRLIGVDGTAYRTQTKADYFYSEPSAFTFDNIYPGTYTIFVDPAGNGFVGSIGTFSVKAGEILDLGLTATASVIFVKPTFKAKAYTDSLCIIEDYPFIADTSNNNNAVASVTIKDLSNSSFISENLELLYSTTTDEGNNKYKIVKKGTTNAYLPTHNGKYEIIVQKSWYDSNTGLSGTLIATDIVNYNTSYNANIDPRNDMDFDGIRLVYQKDFQTNGIIEDIKYEAIKDSGNYYSAYDIDKYLYYNTGGIFVLNTNGYCCNPPDASPEVLDVSGEYALIMESDSTTDITCYNMGNDSYSSDPFVQLEINYLNRASIVANKYIALYYEDTAEESIIALYTHNNSQNPPIQRVQDISFAVEDYTPIDIKLAQKDTDNDLTGNNVTNSCYLAVLYKHNQENKCKIVIYDLNDMNNNNGVVAQSELDGFKTEYSTYLKKFQCLRNNTFYVETQDYNYLSFILNSNSIVDKSSLQNRESCFMDKYGYLYRYDKITKSIIKTSSLDGKPLATTQDIKYENKALELRGILGLIYPSGNDASILAY